MDSRSRRSASSRIRSHPRFERLRRALIPAATLACLLAAPGAALAIPTASMTAAFKPERLGAATTMSASFAVSWSEPRPPVLTAVQLSYPRNLGLATSGLGLAACAPETLQAEGPEACPANSLMGSGSALVEIPLGGILHRESVALTLLAGPSPEGSLHLLASAVGVFPVSALVVLTAELAPGLLSVTIPPIPTLPDGPYVALVAMRLVLGGHLTYYERVHGRNVAYHPAGIGLPRSCPRGGFPFAAIFSFKEGQRADASTSVACPKTSRAGSLRADRRLADRGRTERKTR
jgi:hypothetical protein